MDQPWDIRSFCSSLDDAERARDRMTALGCETRMRPDDICPGGWIVEVVVPGEQPDHAR